jgi:hypothetical protein
VGAFSSFTWPLFIAVFYQEASFEPVLQTLPLELPDNLEVILLTIHLSAIGEMAQHRGSAPKSVDISKIVLTSLS